ncbi:peptidoglycan endopeptidase [Flavobacterium luminosum]|uniref:NlpC/P60 family protein n=1 Tax=Flavobacterium luminosum TaxID=2949086 RepID=A0ABT0TKC0_9FLAO|nr:peptidoglycan endopeptidase [Flavobacterium sp. HXWNR70]MCL9807850.1 NlpC/P60 family protein [Flavobacterium sp. HXWNR70]
MFSKPYSLLLLLLFTFKGFSQEKIKHVVSEGESIYSIAKKYDVKVSEIYQLNPKAKGAVLSLKSVLWIPSKENTAITSTQTVKKVVDQKNITHNVLPKETLYGISKKYKVTVEAIKENNPQVEKEGLGIGMLLQIPVTEETYAQLQQETAKKEVVSDVLPSNKTQEVSSTVATDLINEEIENIAHTVKAKETKYGIAKRYGISIADLEQKNPQAKNGLRIGDVLVIKGELKNEVAETNSGSNVPGALDVASSENAPASMLSLSAEAMMKADFLIAKASENIGVRYRSGGTTPEGFDCSGLMIATFKNIEMSLPRSSRDMAANAGVRIERSQAQKGDLIFFATRGRGVGHVGMITEVTENDIKFIHSSTSNGVIISSLNEPYYAKRFIQINRVL